MPDSVLPASVRSPGASRRPQQLGSSGWPLRFEGAMRAARPSISMPLTAVSSIAFAAETRALAGASASS